MALKPTINLAQKQRLAVTQKMQQSLAILGMSNLQLESFLNVEKADNPLLEVVSPEPALPFSGGTSSLSSIAEETVAASESLIAAVIRQLSLVKTTDSSRNMALVLSENLTGQGYLDQSLEKISESTGFSVRHLQRGLDLLQTLEPAGVGSRSTTECIKLRLQAQGIWDEDHERVLRNMGAIESDFQAFALKSGISTVRLSQILDSIRSQPLDLSESFSGDLVHHVIPDVLFTTSADGMLKITLNEQAFPRIRADSAYLDGSLPSSADVKIFLKRKIERMAWLSHALEKRAATILNIAITLGTLQKSYFDLGPVGMKPLTMKKVAEILEINESTVSRAIAGKFALCFEGTVPLHYFFPSGISTPDGQLYSATMIRFHIRQIIKTEDCSRIPTDTKIAELLAARGITVARRTIAKYREAMNIPKSSIRRVQKRNRLRF